MHPLGLFRSTNLVLLFHTVPSARWFRNTLKTITTLYRMISIQDIESYFYEGRDFNNRCHITFDDGDRAFYECAFPVLREMGIPATLFVSPMVIETGTNYWFQELGYLAERIDPVSIKKTISEVLGCDCALLGRYDIFAIFKGMKAARMREVLEAVRRQHNITVEKRFNVTPDELQGLSRSGLVTIGAHTMNHPVLSNETGEDAASEIRDSVDGLARLLDKDVKYFAYPNGISGLDYSAREQAALRDAGIRLAFATDSGSFRRASDPLAVPRFALAGKEREGFLRVLGSILVVPLVGRVGRLDEVEQRAGLRSLGIFQ